MKNSQLEKKIPQHIKSLIKVNGIEVKSSRFKREPYSYSIYKVNDSFKELFKSDPIYGSSGQAIWNGKREVRKIQEMDKEEFYKLN